MEGGASVKIMSGRIRYRHVRKAISEEISGIFRVTGLTFCELIGVTNVSSQETQQGAP